jgi:hypothetical protein
MSLRSVVVLGLIVVVCVAVIVVSALVQEQLAAAFGPFRFRELFRLFGFFTPRTFGQPEFFRRAAPVIAGWRSILSAIASYAFLFLAGLLTVFAFPRQLRVVRDSFDHGAGELLRMLGIGTFSALMFLCLTVLGILTFLAFPLLLVLPLALLLAAWGGLVGLALAFGRTLDRWAGLKQSSPILDLAFGALVLFALMRIPLAGVVVLVMISLLALGAIVATRFGVGGAWSLAELEPVEDVQS